MHSEMAKRPRAQRLKSDDLKFNEESTDWIIVRLHSKAKSFEIKYSDLLSRIHKFISDIAKPLEFVMQNFPCKDKERIASDINYFFSTQDSLYSIQLFTNFKQDLIEKLSSKSFNKESFKSYINSAVSELTGELTIKEGMNEKKRSFHSLDTFDQLQNSCSKRNLTPVRQAKRSPSPNERTSFNYQKENSELKASLAEITKQRDILKAWKENITKNPNLDQITQKIIKEVKEDNDLLMMKNTCLHSQISYIINSVSKFLALSSKFQKLIREKEGCNSMNMYENEKHRLEVKLREILKNPEGYSRNSSVLSQSPPRAIDLEYKSPTKIEEVLRIEVQKPDSFDKFAEDLRQIEQELEATKSKLQQEIHKNELIGKENMSLKSLLKNVKSVSPYETEKFYESSSDRLKESNRPQRESLQDVIKKLEKSVKQIKEENEKLNKEVEEKNGFVEKLKQELMKAQNKIQKLHENMVKLEKNNKSAKEENTDLVKEVEQKSEEIEHLRQEIMKEKKASQGLLEKIEKDDKVLENIEEENEGIKDELDHKRGLVDSLRLELLSVQKENQNMQEIIAKCEFFIKENKERSDEKGLAERLKQELIEVQREKQILRENIIGFEQENDKFKYKNNELAQELKEKHRFIESLKLKFQSLIEENKKLQEIIKTFEHYEQQTKEKDKKIEENAKELESTKEELIKLLTENENLQLILRNTEQLNKKKDESMFKEELSFKENILQESKGVQTENSNLASNAPKRNSPEKTQPFKERNESSHLLEKLKQNLEKSQAENINLQEIIKRYENLVKQTLNEKDKLSEDLKEQNILYESVKYELQFLKSSNKVIPAKHEKFEFPLSLIKEESESLVQEIEEKSQALEKLKQELVKLQKSNKTLNEQVIKTEMLEKQAREENSEIKQEAGELNKAIQEIDNKNKELVEMVLGLRKDLMCVITEKEYTKIELQKTRENYKKIEFVLKSKIKLYEQGIFSSASVRSISLKY